MIKSRRLYREALRSAEVDGPNYYMLYDLDHDLYHSKFSTLDVLRFKVEFLDVNPRWFKLRDVKVHKKFITLREQWDWSDVDINLCAVPVRWYSRSKHPIEYQFIVPVFSHCKLSRVRYNASDRCFHFC